MAYQNSRAPHTFYTKSSNLILQWPGRGRTMGINEGEIDGAKRNLIVGPSLFNLWHILTCCDSSPPPPHPPGKCQRVRCAIQHSRGLMPWVAAQRQFIAKSICMCTMPLRTDVHVFLSGLWWIAGGIGCSRVTERCCLVWPYSLCCDPF